MDPDSICDQANSDSARGQRIHFHKTLRRNEHMLSMLVPRDALGKGRLEQQ